MPYDADLIKKVDELGVHPFVLIRRCVPDEVIGRYIICPTQNDILAFAECLRALPEFEEFWFLRGMVHALEGHSVLAAAAFSNWMTEADGATNVKAFVGLPSGVEQKIFWGYPALEIGRRAATEDAHCDRYLVLLSLLNAYSETTGNDAARFAITDSIALALCLGAEDNGGAELEATLSLYAARQNSTAYARIAAETCRVKLGKLSEDCIPIFWAKNFENFPEELRVRPENLKIFSVKGRSPQISAADMPAEVARLSSDDYLQSAVFFNSAVEEISSKYHIASFWGDRLLTLDKSAGFLEEGQFAAAFEAFPKDHPYDQYMGGGSIAWRLHTLVWAARLGLEIDGDFVECGTFRGDMAAFICASCDLKAHNKTFHLFDSFDGFSPTLSSEEDYPDNPGFLEYTNQFYKNEGLYEKVVERFSDHLNVKVIKGFLPESLDGVTPDKISFLHVDLNSWQAETACLDVLYDRVSPGGIIIYDDYGWKLFRKQKEAADAFMSSRNNLILELPTGQGLVVKR